MGRKGVSKRKSKKTKSTFLSSDNAGGAVSSVIKASENQAVKPPDGGTIVSSAKVGNKKASKNRKS